LILGCRIQAGYGWNRVIPLDLDRAGLDAGRLARGEAADAVVVAVSEANTRTDGNNPDRLRQLVSGVCTGREVRGRNIDPHLRKEITITRKAERRTCYNRSRPAVRNLDNPMTVDSDGCAVSCRLTDCDVSRAVRSHSNIARFEQVRSDSRERS